MPRLPGLMRLALPLLLLAACAPAPTSAPATAAPPTSAPPTTAPQTAAPQTAAPTEAAGPLMVTDSLGREVTLEGPVERVISLAPSNTEIMYALGAGHLLVGRDDFSDYPPEALEVPSIGSLYGLNAETVVSMAPDLVLAAGVTSPEDVAGLEDLGLTVYATSVSTSLEDVFNDIMAVGRLLGYSAEAEGLVADLRTRVEAVTSVTDGITERPTVFYELDATEPAKPWTAGPNTFVDELITLAGGENVGRVVDEQYYQLSLEQLVAEDPDLIVLGSYTWGGETPEKVAERAGWQDLTAVKTGAVYTFDDNLVSRPGPRVVDGLEAMARLVHPEHFE